MKKNYTFAVIIAALIIAIGSIAVSFATDIIPGSQDDPVVTKAYVDRAMADLKAELSKSIASQNASSSNAASAAAGWEVVQVESGKTVIGGQGTEMILRSGKAVAVHEGANGLSDLTGAVEVFNGTSIKTNHLLLVPRADGRGIKCTESAYVMILGSYEIK